MSEFQFTKAAVTPGVTPASDALKFMASKAESSISGDKPTLGGFTFSTKPVIVDKKEEQKSKEPEKAKVDDPAKEATKQNPFASFTFGATKSISPKGQKGTAEYCCGMTWLLGNISRDRGHHQLKMFWTRWYLFSHRRYVRFWRFAHIWQRN